jgi:hypothetical protein
MVPLRFIAYLLHATRLERIYKPRFVRHRALIELTLDVLDTIPKYSQSITGGRMDPMNLILVGHESQLKLRFKEAGWHRANPASPIHLFYGAFTVLAGKSHRNGPFTPHYINIGLQDFAYQKLTREQSFKRRHHLRIWKTGITLTNGDSVWVAAASFDSRIKFQFKPPWIHHFLDPDLDHERDYIVRDLVYGGSTQLMAAPMTELVYASVPAKNASGNSYFTDGKAVVLEL